MPARASRTAPATTSAASVSRGAAPLSPAALACEIRRAARQTGHQAHSGASSAAWGGSVVAVAQVSPGPLSDPRKAFLTWPPNSSRMLLALVLISQRWISLVRPAARCSHESPG